MTVSMIASDSGYHMGHCSLVPPKNCKIFLLSYYGNISFFYQLSLFISRLHGNSINEIIPSKEEPRRIGVIGFYHDLQGFGDNHGA